MPDRLNSLDVSFLYLEQTSAAMHTGSLMILRPPRRGLDMERFTRFVGARIALAPRYRQRVCPVPGRLANPVWVDDPSFDLSYHVRRSALPRPGGQEQLADLVGRLQSRALDRSRPLWELYVIEGLAEGQFALFSKVHQAMIDGIHTPDLAGLILDVNSRPPAPAIAEFRPQPTPGTWRLVADAVSESMVRPTDVVSAVRSGVLDVRDNADRVARSAMRVLDTARRMAAGAPPRSPLVQQSGPQRRFAMVATPLQDYRQIRTRAMAPTVPGSGTVRPLRGPSGALEITVNDVVLAVLAGALRSWLMTRGEPTPPGSSVRTLAPMSVLPDGAALEPLGSRLAALLIDLPTGEASPMIRLHQVAYQTKTYRDRGRAIDAKSLAGLAGFAPPTLHSLAARAAAGLSRRVFHLLVSNVPGPQHPLYADGSRLLSTHPVVPLAPGQALSIGLTSYQGTVYFGLNADRETLSDVDVIAHCIEDAVTELAEAVQ